MRIIELAAHDATLQIAPELGGAIASFVVRGRPMLRPTPDAALDERDVRRTACYPLVPYSNRIRNAKLRFAGRDFVLARNFGTHPHAIHGVGWQRPWSVAEASREHARLVLRHEPHGDDAAAWPWPFHATQTFHLADVARPDGAVLIVLTVTLTLGNPGAEAFPFGLGWHPYFPKRATTKLGFRADRMWQNDPTQLPVSLVDLPPGWRFAPPRALDAIALDNVFTGWDGAATIGDPAYRTSIAVEADRACTFVVVYAPPDGGFVAVEPVTHETDAFNRAAHGVSGTGMRILPPGAAFSCTMRIAVAAAG
jgi:aldose 1-epimerase